MNSSSYGWEKAIFIKRRFCDENYDLVNRAHLNMLKDKKICYSHINIYVTCHLPVIILVENGSFLLRNEKLHYID